MAMSTLVSEAYEAYHDQLQGYLTSLTRDREVAEDIVQETFARLLREERAGRAPDHTRAWLFQVSRNLVTSRGRRLQVAERSQDRLRNDAVEDSAEEACLARETRAELGALLAQRWPDVPGPVARRFRRLVARRAEGEPVPYIRGSTEFRGLQVTVRRGVFVPRDSRAAQITESFADIDSKLVRSTEEMTARIDSQISDAEMRLGKGAEAIGERLNEQVTRTEAQLIERANAIAETFSAVNEHIGKRTNEATHSIEATTQELNQMLAARSGDIARILDETARPLFESFAESSNELQHNLEAAAQNAAERLRGESAALVSALASRTSDTLNAVEKARGELSESVQELTERLAASSTRLGETVEAATSNFAAVDESISRSTRDFLATTEKATQSFEASTQLIDTNTSRLSELSSRTTSDIGAIAKSISEHGKMLQDASDLLGSAQSNLTSTLEERKAAIENLAISLVKKSEEIEGIMGAFEQVIGKTLEKAEGRTLSSTVRIREAVNEAVEAAGKRFSDATEEIRRTAASIRSELEETRSELRRGVSELPDERFHRFIRRAGRIDPEVPWRPMAAVRIQL
jgi:ABC-type transporter Mla subunit MlaD